MSHKALLHKLFCLIFTAILCYSHNADEKTETSRGQEAYLKQNHWLLPSEHFQLHDLRCFFCKQINNCGADIWSSTKAQSPMLCLPQWLGLLPTFPHTSSSWLALFQFSLCVVNDSSRASNRYGPGPHSQHQQYPDARQTRRAGVGIVKMMSSLRMPTLHTWVPGMQHHSSFWATILLMCVESSR